MRNALTIAVLSAALSFPLAVPAQAAVPDVASIVAQCQATAAKGDGTCLQLVQQYIASIRTLNARSRDQAIYALVLGLGPLTQSRGAIAAAFRKELAQAIKELAQIASTQTLVANLNNLARSVETPVATAAIGEVPASATTR